MTESLPSKKPHKKRKRSTTLTVKIQLLKPTPETTPPLIGYFPSRYDPLRKNYRESNDGDGEEGSDDEEEEEVVEPEVKVYKSRNEKHGNRFELVVSPSGSKVDFVGTSYSGEAAMPKVCSYGLGVLDKETGVLKIVPIAADKIFRLEPRIAEKEHDELPKTTADMPKTTAEADSRYHTKRSQILRKKRESEKENPEVENDLDAKIEDMEVHEPSANVYSVRNVPPHDTTATIPEKAYSLRKILLEGELNYLLDIMEHVESGEEIAPDAYPSFISNRISKLHEIQNDRDKRQLACIFSYMNHLIKFKEQKSLDTFASAKHHKIPSILQKKFATQFVEERDYIAPSGEKRQRRELSAEKQNLLISYILVLTLFADNFRTDITDIATDLKMTNLNLREHYKNLGCKLSREGKLTFVTLPVPLQFPKQKMERRRK